MTNKKESIPELTVATALRAIFVSLLEGALVAFATIVLYSSALWGVLALLSVADLAPYFLFKEVFALVFVVRCFLNIRHCLNSGEDPLLTRYLSALMVVVSYLLVAGLLAVAVSL